MLAVDVKLPLDPKIWKYADFKGGSEDQLLAGNWLLQHRNGLVKPAEVMPAMESILKSIEPTLK